MSSERTLVSMLFYAAFRLSSAEFADEMPVLLLEADGLLGAEDRKGLPFAVASYLRDKCSSVGIERAHNMVAQFRNYRAHFIFQGCDFIGRSILEMNCD
jgi:hypothetical protein